MPINIAKKAENGLMPTEYKSADILKMIESGKSSKVKEAVLQVQSNMENLTFLLETLSKSEELSPAHKKEVSQDLGVLQNLGYGS